MTAVVTPPARYEVFLTMPIAGQWRTGTSGREGTDTEPEAGMTHVNDTPVNDEANTAFGGKEASGIGRVGGRRAVEEFTTHHGVSVQRTPRTFPI